MEIRRLQIRIMRSSQEQNSVQARADSGLVTSNNTGRIVYIVFDSANISLRIQLSLGTSYYLVRRTRGGVATPLKMG